MIRIVGLSATLPNYRDVGAFLGVNPDTGLFYFDASYRPVPLEMQFVGVSERSILAQKALMAEVCYQKARRAGRRAGRRARPARTPLHQAALHFWLGRAAAWPVG